MTIQEPFVPGDYTAIGVVNIRSQMKTSPLSNIIGAYTNGVPFRVYQVYDELDGILWGRVSSNTGSGSSRYVALRVANHEKAKLELAIDDNNAEPDDLISEIRNVAWALREVALALRETK